MDKIKALLSKMGASAELTESIIKSLEDYKKQVHLESDQNFNKRMVAAKKVCLEEINTAKVEMARKIEIFLESKNAAITREIQKQAAIGESEAVKTLRDMKNLLEGVTNDSNAGENHAAVSEETKNLRVMVNKLQDEKKSLEESANRANQIAVKALKRNKILESQLTSGSTTEQKSVASESVQKPATKPVAAARVQSAAPKTTRTVMNESQSKANGKSAPHNDIAAIADTLDGVPAYVNK